MDCTSFLNCYEFNMSCQYFLFVFQVVTGILTAVVLMLIMMVASQTAVSQTLALVTFPRRISVMLLDRHGVRVMCARH